MISFLMISDSTAERVLQGLSGTEPSSGRTSVSSMMSMGSPTPTTSSAHSDGGTSFFLSPGSSPSPQQVVPRRRVFSADPGLDDVEGGAGVSSFSSRAGDDAHPMNPKKRKKEAAGASSVETSKRMTLEEICENLLPKYFAMVQIKGQPADSHFEPHSWNIGGTEYQVRALPAMDELKQKSLERVQITWVRFKFKGGSCAFSRRFAYIMRIVVFHSFSIELGDNDGFRCGEWYCDTNGRVRRNQEWSEAGCPGYASDFGSEQEGEGSSESPQLPRDERSSPSAVGFFLSATSFWMASGQIRRQWEGIL